LGVITRPVAVMAPPRTFVLAYEIRLIVARSARSLGNVTVLTEMTVPGAAAAAAGLPVTARPLRPSSMIGTAAIHRRWEFFTCLTPLFASMQRVRLTPRCPAAARRQLRT
jgi:hypothetical protein